MNNLLSICLPTYNRANFLDKNLERLIKLCKPLHIPIFISDNCSPDNTEEIVRNRKKQYEYIFYKKLEKNRGIDYNMDSVVNSSTTEFSWIFSDDDEIDTDSIIFLISILENHNPDFVLLNNRESNIFTNEIIFNNYLNCEKSNSFISNKTLLEKYSHQMTLLSACLVKTRLWKSIELKNYKSKYYFHLHNILSYLNDTSKIILIGKPLFTKYSGNKWNFDSQEINHIVSFFYPTTINNLPKYYSIKSKVEGIKGKVPTMRILTFLYLRSKGLINISYFPKAYLYLLNKYLPLAFISIFLPKKVCELFYDIGMRVIYKNDK